MYRDHREANRDERQRPPSRAEELYPYSLPSPPKSWLFGGLGYGYGIGCSAGPVFGLGVGISPAGVQFGSGISPLGVFCGVGLAAGAIVGQGSAYVPFGWTSGFFLAPRFVMLEGMADLYRSRMDTKHKRRNRAMDSMWPGVLRNRVRNWLRHRGVLRDSEVSPPILGARSPQIADIARRVVSKSRI
jgi:hypothetical protein